MASRRAQNRIVTNIVARLEAEDNASPEMRKATEEGRNLAEASRRVIRQFQRMDNHSAAVSKNIKSLRDASLRAKVAMETMRGTFAGTVTTLDRLEDKLTLVKIKLDNMGAAGTLLRKGMEALKYAALAAVAAIGTSMVTALRDMGEFSEFAEQANDRLEESLSRLNIAVVRAVTGIDAGGVQVNEWADSVEKLTKVINANSSELSDLVGVVTSLFPGLAALKLAYGELADSTIEYNNELSESIRLSKDHKKFTDDLAKSLRATQALIDRQKREGFGFVPAPGKTAEEVADEQAAARRRTRTGGGGRRPRRATDPTGSVKLSSVDQVLREIEAAEKQAAAEKELEFARRRQANALENLLISAKALNEQAPSMRDNILAEVEAVDMLTPALQDLASRGINTVTNAVGDMISNLVAGEGSMASFAAALAGSLGSTVKQAGAAAVGLGTMSLLLSSGGWTTPGGAGALIGVGGALLATGAILEGLAKRAQKSMAGGGGSASSAAQDAVNAVVNNTSRDRDQGPGMTTIVVGEREMRGFVVDSARQAVDLGELSLVPMGTL